MGKSKAAKKSGKCTRRENGGSEEPPAVMAMVPPPDDARLLRSAAQAALGALPLEGAPPPACAACRDSRSGDDWHGAASAVALPCGCRAHLRCLWARTVTRNEATACQCTSCPACGRSFLPLPRPGDRVRLLAEPSSSWTAGRRGRVAAAATPKPLGPTVRVELDDTWYLGGRSDALVRTLEVRLDRLQVLDERTDSDRVELLAPVDASITDDELLALLPQRFECASCGLYRPRHHFSNSQRKRARADGRAPTCAHCLDGDGIVLRDGLANEPARPPAPFHPSQLAGQSSKPAVMFTLPAMLGDTDSLPMRRVARAALSLHRLGRAAVATAVARDALQLDSGAAPAAATARAQARAVLVHGQLAVASAELEAGRYQAAMTTAQEVREVAAQALVEVPLEEMVPLRAGDDGLLGEDEPIPEHQRQQQQSAWWAAQSKAALAVIEQASSALQAAGEEKPAPPSTPGGSPDRAGKECRRGKDKMDKDRLRDGKWTYRRKDSLGHHSYARHVVVEKNGRLAVEEQRFAMASTPGDSRTRANELSRLKGRDEGVRMKLGDVPTEVVDAHKRAAAAENELTEFLEAQAKQQAELRKRLEEEQARAQALLEQHQAQQRQQQQL